MTNLAGEIVALGDLGLSRIATAERPAFLQKFRTSCTVNRPIHAAAAEEGFIGCIHNRIHLPRCDIAFDDHDLGHNLVGLDNRHSTFARWRRSKNAMIRGHYYWTDRSPILTSKQARTPESGDMLLRSFPQREYQHRRYEQRNAVKMGVR